MVDLLLAPMHAMLEASYSRAYFVVYKIETRTAHTHYRWTVIRYVYEKMLCSVFQLDVVVAAFLLFYKRTFHMPFAKSHANHRNEPNGKNLRCDRRPFAIEMHGTINRR